MQRNAEKFREMQRNADMKRYLYSMTFITFMTFMTHGNVIFDILELPAFSKYSTCWVLEKCEEPCRILKKFVHACVVNVIRAKVLLDFVLLSVSVSETTLWWPT